MVSLTAWYPSQHGIPHSMVSLTAWYPAQHGIPRSMVSHDMVWPHLNDHCRQETTQQRPWQHVNELIAAAQSVHHGLSTHCRAISRDRSERSIHTYDSCAKLVFGPVPASCVTCARLRRLADGRVVGAAGRAGRGGRFYMHAWCLCKWMADEDRATNPNAVEPVSIAIGVIPLTRPSCT